MLSHGIKGRQWSAVIYFTMLVGFWGCFVSENFVNSDDPKDNPGHNASLLGMGSFKLGVMDDCRNCSFGNPDYGVTWYSCDLLEASRKDFDYGHPVQLDVLDMLHYDKVDFSTLNTFWGKHGEDVTYGVSLLPTVGELIALIALTMAYERWKLRSWRCMYPTRYWFWETINLLPAKDGGRTILFWFALFMLLGQAQAVTCQSCWDGNAGCTGGANCLFATRTAANLASLTVAGGAAINIVSLLPASYTRQLPSQVLRTLTALARIPSGAGPPDLGPMTLSDVVDCHTNGRIDVHTYKAELTARLGDAATPAAQVTRISGMLHALDGSSTPVARHIGGINSYGVLGYLLAVASVIVNSGKRTYSAGAGESGSSTGASSSASALSIKVPTSGSMFSEMLMVWQALAHAVGAANILATTPFLQQVVWDGISTLGLLWEEAHCLFIIYLEAIEESQGVLHLGNVFSAGAQDTRLKAARYRHAELFGTCQEVESDVVEGKGTGKPWNKESSPNANKICKTYNFKDARHPPQHLFRDGTCKFRHVCNKWVTDKGPGGMCGGPHPAYACDNPNKTNTKQV